MKLSVKFSICIAFLMLILLFGCGYDGVRHEPQPPSIIVYNVPPDSSTMGNAPILAWKGFDKDGRIIRYEYIDIPKSKCSNIDLYEKYYKGEVEIPDSVELLTGRFIRWMSTYREGDTIYLSLELGEDITEHLFCVRSIDTSDADTNLYSVPECRIYYRTNQPPDSCVIMWDSTAFAEKDTIWMLYDFTYEWQGVELTWRAHDPDNSVILEYNWWVENFDDSTDIARTSLADDSTLGSVFAGFDSTDGWVRSEKTILKNIPTGHWRFIIQVRDDAFYTGAADTLEFYCVKPAFDPSETTIYDDMYNRDYHYKMLLIYVGSTLPGGWDDRIPGFYDDILNVVKNEPGINLEYDTLLIKSFSAVTLPINKYNLKDYSILYIIHNRGPLDLGLTKESIEEVYKYALAGGRVIFEGNGILRYASNLFTDLKLKWLFGLVNEEKGTGLLNWAQATNSDFTDMHVDTSKAEYNAENDYYYLRNIQAVGTEPRIYGIPYSERIFRAGYYEGVDTLNTLPNLIYRTIVTRWASYGFRSAYSAFLSFYMDNSDGSVTDNYVELFYFLTGGFERKVEEEEES